MTQRTSRDDEPIVPWLSADDPFPAVDQALGAQTGVNGLLAIGAVGYLNRPVARLLSHSQSTSEAVTALPWVPVVRVVGDVAKMLGYPVGFWWRWSRGELPHDRRLGGSP